jgi:hypothetical protein
MIDVGSNRLALAASTAHGFAPDAAPRSRALVPVDHVLRFATSTTDGSGHASSPFRALDAVQGRGRVNVASGTPAAITQQVLSSAVLVL